MQASNSQSKFCSSALANPPNSFAVLVIFINIRLQNEDSGVNSGKKEESSNRWVALGMEDDYSVATLKVKQYLRVAQWLDGWLSG